MRIFLAGATGALGSPLSRCSSPPATRSPARPARPPEAEALRAAGAEPVVVDALDRDAVAGGDRRRAARRGRAPAHRAGRRSAHLRDFDGTFALTNRLRTEGTDNLLAGARPAGASRFVAQSYAGWPYARTRRAGQDRGRPARPRAGPVDGRSLAAIRHVEARRHGARTGIVLRYGGLYGPGTGLAAGGEQVELVRKRRFPVVGDGAGVWSFIHVDDAAAATLAALERGAPGDLQRRRRRPRAGRASGCRRSPRRWAPSRRAASRAGSAASPPARPSPR